MKFFVPNLNDGSKAGEVWETLRQSVSGEVKDWQATDRRISKIRYRHNAHSFVAEVGKPHPEDRQEVVYAIFETFGPCYLVCTDKRGVFSGGPFLIGKHDAEGVEDFEGETLP